MKSSGIFFALFVVIQSISIINGDTDNIVITPCEFFAVKNALNFCGKVVLITGSSSGIGAATARLFSYLGADVVVTGRNESRIDEVVEDCKKLSPDNKRPFGIRLDLTIPGNAAKLINETIRVYKKIDILVNNAGIGNFVQIQDPTYNKVYGELQAINEEAHVEVTRLAVPHLEKSSGSITFIASILARNPVVSTGSYSMGKNAIVAFALALCHDLGPNVRVNVISPGIIDGTRIFRLLNPSPREALIDNLNGATSLRRPGAPLDIAKIIVFLSSELSTILNGQNIFADAGAYIPIL